MRWGISFSTVREQSIICKNIRIVGPTCAHFKLYRLKKRVKQLYSEMLTKNKISRLTNMWIEYDPYHFLGNAFYFLTPIINLFSVKLVPFHSQHYAKYHSIVNTMQWVQHRPRPMISHFFLFFVSPFASYNQTLVIWEKIYYVEGNFEITKAKNYI